MTKNALPLVLALLFLWTVDSDSASKLCLSSSDCVEKRCCDRVCLKRKACDGSCVFDADCDSSYGEACVDQKCSCIRPPCLREDTTTRTVCQFDSQCSKNETCKDGICRHVDLTKTQVMNTTVLVIVTTVGLIIFAGAFYLCLRQQKSTRPSLAAKEAHHRAMERCKANNADSQSDKATSGESDSIGDEERADARKRHAECQNSSHKKPPLASPCSLVELSAIIEEDELSEIASK